MKITYYAQKVAEGVYQATGLAPDSSVTQAALDAADVALNIDVPMTATGLEEPYGEPDRLVIVEDAEGNLSLSEKTTEIQFVEMQAEAVEKLKTFTSDNIYSVCDEEKQRTIALFYENMSTVDKSKAKLYFAWHKDMIARHNQIKQNIADATTQEELELIVSSFEEAYAELMASVPYESLDLSTYIH